jgi:hypothetical protein
MTAATVLRHAWMDLLSATGFLAAFLLRERLEPETQSALLLWPVVFEMMLAFALGLASMGNGIARTALRNLWFALVAASFVALAWLGGSRSGLPLLWLAAVWQLMARAGPPSGMKWLGPEHRRWLFSDGLIGMIGVWLPAFFAYLLLIVSIDGDCQVSTVGERVCKSPAWIFAVVWVPYFVIAAIVRGRSMAALRAERERRAPR